MKKKNLLIFGGSSDVGSKIIEELSNEYNIYATKNKGEIIFPVKRKYLCNLNKFEDIDLIIEDIPLLDAVIFSAFPEILEDSKDFEGYLKSESLLRGYMYAMTSLMKNKLKHGGKIINILGQSVNYGLPDAPYMGMAFAAMHNYAKSVNAKYGRRGDFAIYDLLMGPINTKMWNRVSGDIRESWKEKTNNFVKPTIVASYVKQILKHDIGPTEMVIDGFHSLPK